MTTQSVPPPTGSPGPSHQPAAPQTPKLDTFWKKFKFCVQWTGWWLISKGAEDVFLRLHGLDALPKTLLSYRTVFAHGHQLNTCVDTLKAIRASQDSFCKLLATPGNPYTEHFLLWFAQKGYALDKNDLATRAAYFFTHHEVVRREDGTLEDRGTEADKVDKLLAQDSRWCTVPLTEVHQNPSMIMGKLSVKDAKEQVCLDLNRRLVFIDGKSDVDDGKATVEFQALAQKIRPDLQPEAAVNWLQSQHFLLSTLQQGLLPIEAGLEGHIKIRSTEDGSWPSDGCGTTLSQTEAQDHHWVTVTVDTQHKRVLVCGEVIWTRHQPQPPLVLHFKATVQHNFDSNWSPVAQPSECHVTSSFFINDTNTSRVKILIQYMNAWLKNPEQSPDQVTI